MDKPEYNQPDPQRRRSLADYWPLFVLIAVSALVASAAFVPILLRGPDDPSIVDYEALKMNFMHFFMGILLVNFAMLKLFNPTQFVDGFSMYDLLAERVRAYGYIYPYIELVLGFGYVALYWTPWLYLATVAIFGFGALGVVSALKRGLDINCPCMGTILKVPLSTVTLTEDLAMVVMAAWMFIRIFI
jgi:hypothetical protein